MPSSGMGDPHAAAGHPPNRLGGEKSPYLLQHATNPVDWRPWGEEAFAEATRQDKPIFLSIGYSTCHWCHVMAHESFEDPAVAALMNRYFISIKVDREERPDIDGIYMTVCQMMTGRGGWPLTIIMTADKRPFYAATYIPRQDRFGQIGMLALLPRLHEIWRTRRQDIVDKAEEVVAALRAGREASPGSAPQIERLDAAFDQLAHLSDGTNGGFGSRPKFPTPQNLLFLLRYWKRTGNRHALGIAEKTLQAMRRGGIYDQIGFGFHRYSVDPHWLVPHFEKMLYDQALLAYAYTEAFQATGAKTYADTAREVFSYVLTRMTSPEGAFYSAEDADSEEEEGKFYLWRWEDVSGILDEADADLFRRTFRFEKTGNFTDELTGRKTGMNILHLAPSTEGAGGASPIIDPEREACVERARQTLFAVRQRRVPPQKDDKILTDWNGLMIASLAKAGACLDDPACVDAAERAAAFILGRMRRPDGALLHRFHDGEAGIAGTLDDYAFFTLALIELYEATGEASYLEAALDLTGVLMTAFKDPRGGFFFTPQDGEEILVRQKEIFEGAMPSGNAVAVWNLLRLGRMTGETTLLDEAWDAAAAFDHDLRQSPGAYAQFMVALDFAFGPAREVVVVGDPAAEDTRELLRALRSRFLPRTVVILRPAGEASPPICRLAPYTRDMPCIDSRATAYVCTGNACLQPTTDLPTMLASIDA